MKFFFSKTILVILTFSFLFTSCEEDVKPIQPNKNLKPQENTKVTIPRFQGDVAKAYVDKQVSFGPRYPNTQGHTNCKNWMVQQLKSTADEVKEQTFDATTFNNKKITGTNIIARFKPDVKERIVLAAHWDSRPFADKDADPTKQKEPILGADDGGSGVGVLLAIADILKTNPIPMGVDIILFDAEDYGEDSGTNTNSWGLGSQYWSRNPHVHRDDVKYGILLDMVGAKGAKFYKEGISMQYAGSIVNKIWNLAKSMGKSEFFIDQAIGGITDDHYFVNQIYNMPMLDIVNFQPNGQEMSFGKHWHTHGDNMDVIDARTLESVGQVVIATIYRESNKDF